MRPWKPESGCWSGEAPWRSRHIRRPARGDPRRPRHGTGRSTDAGLVRDLGAERFISSGAGHSGQAAGGLDVVRDTAGVAGLTAPPASVSTGTGREPPAPPPPANGRP